MSLAFRLNVIGKSTYRQEHQLDLSNGAGALFLLLSLRWYYSPMWTFASLWTSPSQLFFYLFFQFVILHILISVCTSFHHLFLGVTLVDFPEDYF